MPKGLGIGRLSQLTGVHIETIRYYERVGILPLPARTEGGHRSYDSDFVRRLSFVSRSRRLGFSLDEIQSLLGLVDDHEYSCADVRKLALKHAAEARQKIADLKQIERSLTDMASQCHGNNIPDCPIIDALFDKT